MVTCVCATLQSQDSDSRISYSQQRYIAHPKIHPPSAASTFAWERLWTCNHFKIPSCISGTSKVTSVPDKHSSKCSILAIKRYYTCRVYIVEFNLLCQCCSTTSVNSCNNHYPRRARSAIGVDTVLTLDVYLYVCMLVL